MSKKHFHLQNLLVGHVNHLLVDQTVYAEKQTVKQYVPASKILSAIRLTVAQNVFKVLIVLYLWLALIGNARTHAQDPVAITQYATLTIIIQYVPVHQDILVLHLATVMVIMLLLLTDNYLYFCMYAK